MNRSLLMQSSYDFQATILFTFNGAITSKFMRERRGWVEFIKDRCIAARSFLNQEAPSGWVFPQFY